MNSLYHSYILKFGALCISILVVIVSCAQLPQFNKYTAHNGLPSSMVYRCIQDNQGFMWFATDAGVSRFDGKNFDNFTIDDGLPDNEIFNLTQDSKGRIWFLAMNGKLGYYINHNFYNESNDTLLKQCHSIFSYVDIFEDSRGRLWFGTIGNTLTCIDGSKVSRFFENTIEHFQGPVVMESEKNQLFVYCGKKKLLLNEGNGQFEYHSNCDKRVKSYFFRVSANESYFLNQDYQLICANGSIDKVEFQFCPSSLRNISRIDSNTLAISGYCDSLVIYDKVSKGKSFLNLNTTVNCTYTDLDGNLWICTSGDGLWFSSSWKFAEIWDVSSGLGNEKIYSLFKDSDGGIVIGCDENSLSRLSQGKLTNSSKISLSKPGRILSIAEGPNGELVGGGDAGAFLFNDPEKVIFNAPFSNSVGSIAAIKNLNFTADGWMVCAGANLYSFEEYDITGTSVFDSILGSRTFCSEMKMNGDFWLSIANKLVVYSKLPKSISNEGKVIFESRVLDLEVVDRERMLAVADGLGIVLFVNTTPVDTLKVKFEMPADNSRRISYQNGKVYCATNNGVVVLDVLNDSLRFRRFITTSDGLPSPEVYSVLISENKLYCGSDKGLAIIQLDKIPDSVSSFSIYTRKVWGTWGETNGRNDITFDYSNNNLNIEFGAITFSHADELKFEYSFDNAEWYNMEGSILSLLNLTYGNHQLQIRATKRGLVCNNTITLYLKIIPPFWKSNLFIIGILCVILGLFYGFYRIRLNSVRQQSALKNHMLDLELKAMKAQMNPHFIFNVLNSINYYIGERDTVSAQNYLGKFSKMIRSVLDNSENVFNTWAHEMELLKWYLELEQIRFESKVNYEIKVHPDLENLKVLIPSMIIQPFVENSLKHGMTPESTNFLIQITLSPAENECIRIDVKDNGIGRKEATARNKQQVIGTVHSTKLLADRFAILKSMYDYSVEVQSSDLIDGDKVIGTLVTLTFPQSPQNLKL